MPIETIRGSKMFSVSVDDTVFKIRNISLSAMDKYDCGLHFHHNYEVHCILSGSEQMSTLDTTTSEIKHYTIDEHSLMVVPPNVFHSTRSDDSFSFFSFTFDIKPSEKNSRYSLFADIEKALTEMNTPMIIQNDEISAAMKTILDYMKSPTGYLMCDTQKIRLIISRIILNIADSILKDDFSDKQKHHFDIFSPDREFMIKEFISMRYSLPNALTALAETLHLSERQTQISVKKIMGKTFKELILEQKMTIAKILIETTSLSLSEIAENIGYNSYASFFTAYKNHYGCSPVSHRSVR